MTYITVYGGLLLVALLAATILPAQSEGVLVGLILSKQYLVWLLWLVATIGNTVGSVINWWLGYALERFQHKRWFPLNPKQLARAQHHFQRYGLWSLLFSWLPIIGDPLTVIAGLLRVPLWQFIPLVTLAKGGRYAVLVLLVTGF